MNFTEEKDQIFLRDEQSRIIAKVTFPETSPGVVNITHTIVDPSLQGQGVAGKLLTSLAGKLRKENKKAVLTCSYAIKWFDEHPDQEDLLQP